MPAKTEKQARLFRLVRALQKGGIKSKEVSPQVRKMARTIKPSSVKHFTKVKEIIQRLKENEYSLSKMKKVKGVSLKQHLMKRNLKYFKVNKLVLLDLVKLLSKIIKQTTKFTPKLVVIIQIKSLYSKN